MFQLGEDFLAAYYLVLLRAKNSVLLWTEEVRGQICGLTSGSLDVEEHFQALQRNRVRLLLAAMPALLRRSRHIKGI